MKGRANTNENLLKEGAHFILKANPQKLSEATRKSEKEELLREIIDKNPISMAIVRQDGTIEYINRKAVETFGYELTDIPDMAHWWELAYPDEIYRAESMEQWMGLVKQAIIQHREIERREYRITCKNGVVKTVIVFGNIIADTIFVIFEDITEQKRVENALRESNQLFSLFMRHSPIYTFIKEVTATKSLVLQASDNFGQMIGIAGYDMIGKTMSELFPAEFAAKMTADDWLVVSKGNVLELDEELDGKYYKTIKFPITLRDKTLLAGYTIDVTALKQLDDALLLKTKHLEEANTALKVFIGQLEESKADLEGTILSNIRELVLPYFIRLKNTPLSDVQQAILQAAESNLENISSTFLRTLKQRYYNLSPRESEVAAFVREGKSAKEIAEILCLSEATIKLHRSSLRTKLGVRNKKINLRSYLVAIK